MQNYSLQCRCNYGPNQCTLKSDYPDYLGEPDPSRESFKSFLQLVSEVLGRAVLC